MKATADAPSNIALIKYWGKKNEGLRLPTNSSISVNLSNIFTTTTVEFSKKYQKDDISINDEKKEEEVIRVKNHLDRIRKLAKINLRAKVTSSNNFPTASGLASSSSGFAALTVAAAKAAGLRLSEKELTVLARLGSGSACRSISDGFVLWRYGKKSEDSYAQSIFAHDYWKINIVLPLVEAGRKEVSSTDGHKLAHTSPFFNTRLQLINKKVISINQLIKTKKFQEFGELVESEALELHSIMFTSKPSLIYWQPATIKLMKLVKKLRADGLPVYFTIDAGSQLYIFCQRTYLTKLTKKLMKIKEIKKIIVNRPSVGARLTEKHLF